MARTRRDRGLTLLELMVALGIVALLAAIAYPSYRRQVIRAHRTEAVEALIATAAAQERFYLANGHYAGAFAGAGGGAADGLPLADKTPGGRYLLVLSLDAGGQYTASATPVAGRGQDQDLRCAIFRLRADGLRSAVAADGSPSTHNCWA